MAVRRFLKHTSSGDLQEMTSAEMDLLKSLAIRAYALNPSTTLERVGDQSGNMGNYYDTFLIPGSAVSTNSSFYSEANTPDTQVINNVNWGLRLKQNTSTISTPTDTNNILYPVYFDGDQNIRSCNLQDMIDTIFADAIQDIISSSEDYTKVGGTFAIYVTDNNPSNTTLVDDRVVFQDQTNTTDYSDREGVPYGDTAADATKTTQTTYKLYKFDTPPVPAGLVNPVSINATDGSSVQTLTTSQLETMFTDGINHTSRNVSGSTLLYSVNGSGSNKGQGMEDTRQTASRFFEDQDGDTYYTQEVPNGSVATVSTYQLKLTAN